MNIFPCYTHIINPKLKNIYLGFDEHGELVIKSPKVSIEKIEKLIISKASWIKKTQIRLKNKKGQMSHLNNTDKMYYLGEASPLELITMKCRPKLELDKYTGFKLYGEEQDNQIFTKLANKFYLEQSSKYITPKVEKWSKTMGLYPSVIKYRKTKRQWGSCSGLNSICFNTMLMKLPPIVIEYVIIHELAHIKYKHHQKDFWDLVESHCPNHKSLRKQLKEYV
jgi:predicted metal-dependent hydrolase